MLKKLIVASLIIAMPTFAIGEADGPDAWQVTGVASWDSLSVRMGPGTKYIKIGELPPNTRHLRYTECVPYLNAGIWENLSDYQRNNLPQRWCMVFDSDRGIRGWVAGKYLAEDSLD
jgi:hypothetical protein